MIQVLLFHAWHIGSPIGIDAFIMISAYLMTSSFIRRSEAGRMPLFLERWANTFKRLLPPLVVVVLATVWASLRLLSPTRWLEILEQALASITYWQNWRLVHVAADYYADDHALASPLQHLWSMSMQGQVFLLWPVIMTLCVLLARVLKRSIRPVALAAFLALTFASLLWLVLWAPHDAGLYFDTRARVWEFSLGSALAVAAPWLRTHVRGGKVLSWTGLGVLLLFSLVSIGEYPGPMAAVPMLAVSLILIFPAVGENTHGVDRLLSLRPLAALGDVSYSVYLVHWPIFVLYLSVVSQSRLEVLDGIVLILLAVAVAVALTRLVDDPVRNWQWANRSAWRKLLVVLVSLIAGVVPLRIWNAQIQTPDASSASTDSAQHPGAAALAGPVPAFTTDPVPDVSEVHDGNWRSTLPDSCSPGYPNEFDGADAFCSQDGSQDHASARVLAAGNSHLRHFLPLIQKASESNNWFIQASHMGSCAWGMPEYYEGACQARNQALLDYVDRFKPDYVILVTTETTATSPEETLAPGVEELVQTLTARGIHVIGIRDSLRSDQDLLSCSLDHPTTQAIGGCFLTRRDHQAATDPADALASPLFHQIDMTDQFCAGDLCPTIIGNVNVYVDPNHISREYAETIAPEFSRRVSALLASGTGSTGRP